MPNQGEATELLYRWKVHGDPDTERALSALVLDELQKVAARILWRNRRFDHKVVPRELVSEAYLRLCDYSIDTSSRKAFFIMMARAMRHYVIDIARRDRTDRRPSSRLRAVDSNVLSSAPAQPESGVLEFYAALDALHAVHPRQAQTIELRVMGFENHEIARELAVATVKRDVAEARAFLAYRLGLPPGWIRH